MFFKYNSVFLIKKELYFTILILLSLLLIIVSKFSADANQTKQIPSPWTPHPTSLPTMTPIHSVPAGSLATMTLTDIDESILVDCCLFLFFCMFEAASIRQCYSFCVEVFSCFHLGIMRNKPNQTISSFDSQQSHYFRSPSFQLYSIVKRIALLSSHVTLYDT